jgi:hypothetical protein
MNRRPSGSLRFLLIAILLAGASSVTTAGVVPGDVAPDFVKNELDAPVPAARSLASWPDRVIVLFLLGYN